MRLLTNNPINSLPFPYQVLTKKPTDAYSNLTEEQRRQQRERAIALMCRLVNDKNW